MKSLYKFITPLVLLSLTCGCERKDSAADPETGAPPSATVEITRPAVATHLGFATRVPADCDIYFSAFYEGGELFEALENLLLAGGMAYLTDEPDESFRDERKAAFDSMGTELFLFVGAGLGDQLKVIGTTYRELSAAWAGLGLKTLLGLMADGDADPDFKAFGERLAEKLSDEWMAAIKKDSRLRVPSVVAGWKPDAAKLEECLAAVGDALTEAFRENDSAKPVAIERHGVSLKGYEIEGVDVFKEWIEWIGELIESKENIPGIDAKERLEKLMAALRNVSFTIASGTDGGRVILYFGDGAEGFRLADDPRYSLAAKDALLWMEEAPGKSVLCATYLSKPMVGAVLPWLDSSSYWKALAEAVGPPLREEETFRRLLLGLAGVTRNLGERVISEWSAAAFSGSAWVLETRGGIIDPALDHDAPLKMREAALAGDPAFVAHWVQNREWNDLTWSRLEHFGALLELVLREWNRASPRGMAMVPDGFTEGFVSEIIALNRMYRDEFREGIGDEVVVFGDFLGEMPTVPGIPLEVIREQTVPRMVIARPLASREIISAAGESLTKSLRSIAASWSESLGISIPAILPQSLESGGMVTWYPPLPFIGGDFVPGVSINENVWMLGTSRSLARDFSKAMRTAQNAGETGMVIEVDLERLVAWAAGLERYQADRIDALAGEFAQAGAISGEAMAGISEAAKRWKKFSYRSWLESGNPRARYLLEFHGDP